MAYSTRTYTPGSSTTTFALTTSGGDPIGYIQESDIKVTVNSVVYTNAASGSNTYQITGTSTVEQPNGGNVVLNAGVTGTVVLERTTAIQSATVTYTAGSTLTASDLNNADNQIRFGLQEFSDDYAALLGTGGNLTSLGSFIGGSDTWVSNDGKAATTSAIDGRIDTKATAKVKDDIIATAPVSIADDSPSAGKITISVDAELTELATMSTGTAQALADLTGTEVQILDGATVTTDQLNRVDATSSIQTQLNAKQASAADLTNLSSMQTGASAELASLTSTELDILDDAVITTTELNYLDNVTSNVQTQLDGKQASGSYQPLDGDLTTLAGMQAGTASILAGGTALISTLSELNQINGKTVGETSLTTNSNTAIPTSKAVADHVASSTTALGGFVAISGPTNFPSTQPAQGVVVSISDVGGSFTVASQEITITNGAGTGNNVKITGFPSVLNGQVADNTGLQVTSDINNSTSGSPNVHRYVYHKLLATETDVAQLSDDINDFNARYRTGNSDPGSDNDEGDLFFNKTSNTMKVYDGSNWGEVTSTGDFKFLFLCPTGGSGAPTIDGSVNTYDLRETSNSGTGASVTNAAQLIVSVNGVIQQPNAGISTSGLDGFVMIDANTIKFAANLPNGADVFVIQVGSAVTLNAPANNTVATDTLQSQAVTEAKMLISNDPSNGKFLQYKDSTDKLTWADVPAGVGGANAVQFNDDVKATWGTSTNDDLEIYHDGDHSYIYDKNDDGLLILRSTGDGIEIQKGNGAKMAKFVPDDAATLYFNGNAKIATVTGGATITGTCTATAFVGSGVGLTGVVSTSLDGCGYENDQTISAGSYSIAANKGMHSVGPITNNGTVTVNGTWVIS